MNLICRTIMLISVFCNLISGCITLEDVQNINSDKTLNLNDIVYNHKAGFHVIQILSDGTVLASHSGYVHYVINNNTGIRVDTGTESFLDIHVIPLRDDYVDGQALRIGYYQYIGNYKYTTIENKERIVRQYKEIVKDE